MRRLNNFIVPHLTVIVVIDTIWCLDHESILKALFIFHSRLWKRHRIKYGTKNVLEVISSDFGVRADKMTSSRSRFMSNISFSLCICCRLIVMIIPLMPISIVIVKDVYIAYRVEVLNYLLLLIIICFFRK